MISGGVELERYAARTSLTVFSEVRMDSIWNRPAGSHVVFSAALLMLASASAIGQGTGHEWQKVYPISGGGTALTIETGDSGLDITSCGGCKSIQVHVESTRNLSEYTLEERQEGDHVFFTLKEKPHVGLEIHWNENRKTKVTVETPGKLDLDASVQDGNFSGRDLWGSIQIRSGDGSVTLEDIKGDLRLHSADGNINLQHIIGTIQAHGSDGNMKIDGQFTSFDLETSDGSLDLALAPGSQLSAASRIRSSDGHVSIRVPKDFAADLDVSSSDGHIDSSLPLTLDHYNSAERGGHHLRGRLNAGTVPFAIYTSDGNVNLASL
jgi:hypothetical protein